MADSGGGKDVVLDSVEVGEGYTAKVQDGAEGLDWVSGDLRADGCAGIE